MIIDMVIDDNVVVNQECMDSQYSIICDVEMALGSKTHYIMIATSYEKLDYIIHGQVVRNLYKFQFVIPYCQSGSQI